MWAGKSPNPSFLSKPPLPVRSSRTAHILPRGKWTKTVRDANFLRFVDENSDVPHYSKATPRQSASRMPTQPLPYAFYPLASQLSSSAVEFFRHKASLGTRPISH